MNRSKGKADMFFACVDIGGTFTDLVVYSDETGLGIFQAPTTPGEFERGFMDALQLAAERHGPRLRGFPPEGRLDLPGTTASTNPVLRAKERAVGPFPN